MLYNGSRSMMWNVMHTNPQPLLQQQIGGKLFHRLPGLVNAFACEKRRGESSLLTRGRRGAVEEMKTNKSLLLLMFENRKDRSPLFFHCLCFCC